ncbi:MAG: type IV secretory system conjugative DNA transfer family protein, partial [Acidobacteria bacterium]|nr:type IV secretory system conjugative DNA transfer family protein [Acidobacteriota bacterium]
YPQHFGEVLVYGPVGRWGSIGAGIIAALLVAALLHERLRRHVPLFAPLLVVAAAAHVGPVMLPEDLAGELRSLLEVRGERGFAIAGTAYAVLATGGLMMLCAARPLGRLRGAGVRRMAHGSSRLATDEERRAAGFYAGRGILLGQTGRGRRLWDASENHVLVALPPGGGKTSGPLIGTLLTNPQARAIVLDPKGEIWRATAGYRTQEGNQCIRYQPLEPGSLSWNPLAALARTQTVVRDVGVLATNLIPSPPGEASHWTAKARTLFTGMTLHLLFIKEEPSLADVRNFLTAGAGAGGFDALLLEMASTEHDPRGEFGWRDPITGAPTRTHPEVRRIALGMHGTDQRERSGIVSTTTEHLELWGDPIVDQNTQAAEIELARIFEGPTPMTLYVTLPEGRLEYTAPLLRILFASFLNEVTGREDRVQAGGEPIYLLIDEFPALGHLKIFEGILAVLRGYGVRCLIVVQNLRQLIRVYGPHQTISANCQTLIAGATQEHETREHISRLLGTATVEFTSRTHSGGLLSAKASRSRPILGRRLFTPEEVGLLAPEEHLVVRAHCHPVLARRLPYFEDRELRRRAAIPPPAPRWGEGATL